MGDLGQYVCIDGSWKRTLSARQAEQIIHQITSALMFIHYGIRITIDKQGCIKDVEMSEHPTLIHRDIKPQNIFISYLDFDNPSDGEIHVKLGDFSCAKQLNDISSMTITGTVGYQALES
ncbi:hypothetical protein CC80DRAFT_597440 [Byssothecium circinans]|uniref:Autophagy-related protein 1 n=1 Tax=Byssothecium circinans TaxID=147558 RepID=A0A6A5TFD8_9PLEO|nr:hypothetical protein CC80DRAFT_597440 [Byssothecium circinans]